MRVAMDEVLRWRLQQAAEDIIAARFSTAPLLLACPLRQITDPDRLRALIQAVAGALDLVAVEQAIAEAQQLS